MGWLDDFGQGFAQGFVPTYTNRMAQQQRQEDALALKYMDKFSTVKAKNDKASKVRKEQLAKARSIVKSQSYVSSYTNEETAIKFVADMIINQDIKDDDELKNKLQTALNTRQINKDTVISTDFSYAPDPMPTMATTPGGIDTSGMSTMGRFLAESLGVSSTASNANIASTVKKEKIDNLETTTETKKEKVEAPTVENVKVNKVKAEEEEVSGVVTQSSKPLKRPFDFETMEQGDLEATQAIMDEQTGEAFPGAVQSSFPPLSRPKIKLANAEQEISDFLPWPERLDISKVDDHDKFSALIAQEKLNSNSSLFNSKGEFDYGKEMHGENASKVFKSYGNKLLAEKSKKDPGSFFEVKDVLKLTLADTSTVLQSFRNEFVKKGVLSKDHDWSIELSKTKQKRIISSFDGDPTKQTILRNVFNQRNSERLIEKGNTLDEIFKVLPKNPNKSDVLSVMQLAEAKGISVTSDTYRKLESLRIKVPTYSEQQKIINKNADKFYSFRDAQLEKLSTPNSDNIAALESKLANAKAISLTLTKTDEVNDLKSLISNLESRLASHNDNKILDKKDAPVDLFPSLAFKTILAQTKVDDLPTLKGMLRRVNKTMETNDSIELEERKDSILFQIDQIEKTITDDKSILYDSNGNLYTKPEEFSAILTDLNVKLEEIDNRPPHEDGINTLAKEKLRRQIKIVERAEKERFSLKNKNTTKQPVTMASIERDTSGQNETTFFIDYGKNYQQDLEGNIYLNNQKLSQEDQDSLVFVTPALQTTFNTGLKDDRIALAKLLESRKVTVRLLNDLALVRGILEANPDVANHFSDFGDDVAQIFESGIEFLTTAFRTESNAEGFPQKKTYAQALEWVRNTKQIAEGRKELAVATLSIVYGLAGQKGSSGMALSDKEMAATMNTVFKEGESERAIAILNGHFQDTLTNYAQDTKNFNDIKSPYYSKLKNNRWWEKKPNEYLKTMVSTSNTGDEATAINSIFDQMSTEPRVYFSADKAKVNIEIKENNNTSNLQLNPEFTEYFRNKPEGQIKRIRKAYTSLLTSGDQEKINKFLKEISNITTFSSEFLKTNLDTAIKIQSNAKTKSEIEAIGGGN